LCIIGKTGLNLLTYKRGEREMRQNFLFAQRSSSIKSKAERPGVKRLTFITITFFISFVLFMAYAYAQETKTGEMKKFYQTNCVRCHGADGSAFGADGKSLKGQDFTDPKWQKETNDDKIIKVILNGKFFGLAMPAYKEIITRDDARVIVTEIIRKSEKGKTIAP
jgi:mono/diheme cytochrome c family protein